MIDIHKMTVAELEAESEDKNLLQGFIWAKAYRLEEERNELLAALEEVLPYVEGYYQESDMVSEAKEVIAKAKGKS